MLQNINNAKVILIFLTISITALAIGFFMGQQRAIKNIEIQYISQNELLDLEKSRISGGANNQELFFGKPEEAIKYIESAQKKMSKNGVIVLLSDSKIYGTAIRSISKKVHSDMIENLSKK